MPEPARSRREHAVLPCIEKTTECERFKEQLRTSDKRRSGGCPGSFDAEPAATVEVVTIGTVAVGSGLNDGPESAPLRWATMLKWRCESPCPGRSKETRVREGEGAYWTSRKTSGECSRL